MCAIFFVGYCVVLVKTESRSSNHILHSSKLIQAYEAVVAAHVEEKKNSFKTTVVIQTIKTGSGWIAATGKVNLYISKKTFINNLQWGDHLVVEGVPQEVLPPSNPHEFDFKRFLTFKNIYHQQFIQGDSYRLTGQTEKGFFHYSSLARKYFSTIIQKYVDGEQEEAIALALVIGVTDGVDNELINAYSASGAMHVLAVSGLHVGIIYGIILFLLRPLKSSRRGQWIVAGVSLFILWSYSFVTGLSPSVLRAVVMFSFMAISRPLNIRSNIFNTLAGSAFILLLYDPYLIMSVGFQLSYLAVLGIIWIQRPIYQLWEAKTWLMDQVWQITCVSIAAQATTFSLGLLYFHQFPTYFLFSNLFVIPISFVVLVVGLVLICVSFMEPVANLVGWVLHWSVKILNEGVFVVEDLPLSIINNIYIDVFQSWLIMGILTCLIFIFQYKRIQWLYLSMMLGCMLAGARWVHYFDRTSETKMIVYNVSGQSVLEFKEENQTVFMTDSTLLSDSERIRFHIRPNRLYNMVSETKPMVIAHRPDIKGCKLLEFSGKSILFIAKPLRQYPATIKPDFIVLAKEAAWKTSEIILKFPQAQIILDSSWGAGQVKWLKKQSQESTSRIYSVTESGAFMVML